MSKWVTSVVIVALVAGCASLPDVAKGEDPLATAAEIRNLEDSWTTAFNSHDTRFMERIMAPEFVVVGSGGTQQHSVTSRSDWMKVWLGADQHPYEAKVLHVVVAGDTAVASLEARWRRKSYVTDTWTRRNGDWQLVHRHSTSRAD